MPGTHPLRQISQRQSDYLPTPAQLSAESSIAHALPSRHRQPFSGPRRRWPRTTRVRDRETITGMVDAKTGPSCRVHDGTARSSIKTDRKTGNGCPVGASRQPPGRCRPYAQASRSASSRANRDEFANHFARYLIGRVIWIDHHHPTRVAKLATLPAQALAAPQTDAARQLREISARTRRTDRGSAKTYTCSADLRQASAATRACEPLI